MKGGILLGRFRIRISPPKLSRLRKTRFRPRIPGSSTTLNGILSLPAKIGNFKSLANQASIKKKYQLAAGSIT